MERTVTSMASSNFEIAPPKAYDYTGRFREIISDPINILIDRHAMAGVVDLAGKVMLHNGLMVPFSGSAAYYGNFSEILALNRGVHEPLEEYVFQQTLKSLYPSSSMLELGSYWAHYSMWLKSVYPQSSTTCVEIDAAALDVGRANFLAHGFEGEFIKAAVASGQFNVDGFIADRCLTELTILHSDIQGFEVEMLAGASQSLAKRLINYVFISTHDNLLHSQTVSALAKAGYRVEVSSDFESQTTSFDGFVFASSPTVEPVVPNLNPLGRVEIALADPQSLISRLTSWSQPAGLG